jgi:hypothetical protein
MLFRSRAAEAARRVSHASKPGGHPSRAAADTVKSRRDFFSDWIQHGHIAIMRGVESGFSVVRSAKGGSMFVSDDRGPILAETRSDSAPFATLLVNVPSRHEQTLCLRWGDWFAWLALGLLACTLGLLRFYAEGLSEWCEIRGATRWLVTALDCRPLTAPCRAARSPQLAGP